MHAQPETALAHLVSQRPRADPKQRSRFGYSQILFYALIFYHAGQGRQPDGIAVAPGLLYSRV